MLVTHSFMGPQVHLKINLYSITYFANKVLNVIHGNVSMAQDERQRKKFGKHFMLWRKKRNVRKGFIFHSKSSEISTDIETFLKQKCDQKTLYIFNESCNEIAKGIEERQNTNLAKYVLALDVE